MVTKDDIFSEFYPILSFEQFWKDFKPINRHICRLSSIALYLSYFNM